MSNRRGPITRAGRSTLRWAVRIAAMNAIRVPGPLRDFKLRLQERRPKGVALCERNRTRISPTSRPANPVAEPSKSPM